ncbi:predicted protein [Aspergillus nidulans FGSC A4]|uniref:Uncharacterized protein n=1 Tax=Emericella nidulans (strain FGSC A4 / ATCC 38163 / CBS 112.46 / NRRL 194 / M139) TaxID=227321 RepID=Q5AVI8_EMENI|nr:hypothetical protein [Aspergillus nidulans FGSC A4]EAA61878.1 predicted protein [Aspergillus nidulans FGSC A4]CBF79914.1 TPA: conserved hypothetical protein [Aspergillus nidulans FGSC A4]|eukprot:XP_680961.1 predicted protein [Aspergillus nidulans FGSC A4]
MSATQTRTPWPALDRIDAVPGLYISEQIFSSYPQLIARCAAPGTTAAAGVQPGLKPQYQIQRKQIELEDDPTEDLLGCLNSLGALRTGHFVLGGCDSRLYNAKPSSSVQNRPQNRPAFTATDLAEHRISVAAAGVGVLRIMIKRKAGYEQWVDVVDKIYDRADVMELVRAKEDYLRNLAEMLEGLG